MNEEIKLFCEERGITSLFHFTNIENVPSILEYGLLTRTNLDDSGISYFPSDEARYDGYPESVSLSISYPNHSMLSSKRNLPEEKWAVIELDVSILWNKDCAFFATNAASSESQEVLLENAKGISSLHILFQREIDEDVLPVEYPDDVQAEVLCFENIETGYIISISVKNDDDYNALITGNNILDLLNDLEIDIVSSGAFFHNRCFYIYDFEEE